MIKRISQSIVLIGILTLATRCHPSKRADSSSKPDATAKVYTEPADTALYATLQPVTEAPSLQDSLMIRFTVTNPTNKMLKFTTYHTPFEGLISKFLTITDSAGNEVNYQGPMAKRVMPPPAETFHTLAPGQSKSIIFDLQKCYKIEYPGTYSLQYNAEKISGISNGDAIKIKIAE